MELTVAEYHMVIVAVVTVVVVVVVVVVAVAILHYISKTSTTLLLNISIKNQPISIISDTQTLG